MKGVIPAWTIAAACALAVSASAQDSTIKSKTRTTIKADDAKTMTMTGCLSAGADGTFTLTKAKPQIDIGTTLELPPVGTAGANLTTYQLTPRSGVSLTPHVGHTVEITALAVPPATASDDDAKVKVKSKTKVEVDGHPDAHVETQTKAHIPRGATSKLMVASVKHLAPTCQ
jgi:hypothetical protein